jgi:hypothetical protein
MRRPLSSLFNPTTTLLLPSFLLFSIFNFPSGKLPTEQKGRREEEEERRRKGRKRKDRGGWRHTLKRQRREIKRDGRRTIRGAGIERNEGI